MLRKIWMCMLLPLSLALSGCQSAPPKPVVRFLEVPRLQVPPLPADLAQKREPTSCRKLLSLFSASPQTTHDLCGISMP